ncbi:Uncharacterised protein [Mycobacteroides abscessus subsp. abscessus]|nr:Uncharacterised protein [Mycobacteroides abscessus subsp. abscessus]
MALWKASSGESAVARCGTTTVVTVVSGLPCRSVLR